MADRAGDLAGDLQHAGPLARGAALLRLLATAGRRGAALSTLAQATGLPASGLEAALRELVAAGAPEDILIKARPHIGTDRLIKVVRHIREEIIALGGEVRFGARVSDIVVERGTMRAVTLADGAVVEGGPFVFAVGHSSRDTFAMLHRHGVPLEPKPFSVGVRIEHPQRHIDRMLYGQRAGHPLLGSAPYKFVAHCPGGRSAYSFCMCPGGLVVAATSEEGMVVTNGMSSYARAEANANSGFMVEVGPQACRLLLSRALVPVEHVFAERAVSAPEVLRFEELIPHCDEFLPAPAR